LPSPADPVAGRLAVRVQAEITERFVSLPNRLLEARFGSPLLKRVALRCVAGDAIENGSQNLRLLKTLGKKRLIDEQLHHLKLVQRQPGNPPGQIFNGLIELVGGMGFDGESGLNCLPPVQAISREEQPFRPLCPEPVRPHRGCRGTPDPGRWIADLRVVSGQQQVTTKGEIGPAGHTEAMNLAEHRLAAVKQ